MKRLITQVLMVSAGFLSLASFLMERELVANGIIPRVMVTATVLFIVGLAIWIWPTSEGSKFRSNARRKDRGPVIIPPPSHYR